MLAEGFFSIVILGWCALTLWILITIWGIPLSYAIVITIVYHALTIGSKVVNYDELKGALTLLTIPMTIAIGISFCDYMWGWNKIVVGVVIGLMGAVQVGVAMSES